MLAMQHARNTISSKLFGSSLICFGAIAFPLRVCFLLLLLLFWASSHKVEAQTSDLTLENVRFESDGASLAGTIFKPKHSYAAVIIVHGSGQEKRMTEFASLLAKNGITVLTYDKRGVGESEGVYAGPEVGTNNIDSFNLTLLATDASAATNTLLAHLPPNHVPIGLIGFSQAGWIVPIAAKKNTVVSFMVLFSGPVVTAREQLRFQFFTQGNSNFWETHTEAEARDHIRNEPDKYQFADTDPHDALTKLSIRGFWLFGGKDVQAPVHLSMEHLNALKAIVKPYEYRLFPTLGHNTAFADSHEPVNAAIKWIKAIGRRTKRN